MVHISDGDLMLYCLGMMENEELLGPIEEHLICCRECLKRAEDFQHLTSGETTET